MKRILLTLSALLLVSIGINAETRITLSKAGTLASLLSQVQQDTITSLVIEGPINSADIRLLRRMAGYREHESDKAGRLRTLDLRNARIISDKEPYLVLDAGKENLKAVAYRKTIVGGIDIPRFEHYGLGTRTVYDNNYVYEPRYILGESDDTTANGENPRWSIVATFNKKISREDRRNVHRYDMKSMSGHRLKYKNGHYHLYCYTHKNEFSLDMFYLCPRIEAIALPNTAKVNENLIVLNNTIRYYQFQ